MKMMKTNKMIAALAAMMVSASAMAQYEGTSV